jgi:Arc-like DNA binding domain
MAKKTAKRQSGKDTDQFIVRMPPGMRDTFAKLAEERGRSMNSEVVTALAAYIAQDGESDQRTIKDALADIKESLDSMRERVEAATGAREQFSADLKAQFDADPDAASKNVVLAFREFMRRQK